MMNYRPFKRAFDIIGSAGILLASAPIMAGTAALVAYFHGRPILFTQSRPGLNGEVFQLYKFRSMREVDEAAGLITDEQRITPFGRVLRSTSLDELPSLFNVLKGEMSLVGPRPLLVRYLGRYTEHQARRHEVRPGITGLAQVSGRNALSWEVRFDLDVVYVDSLSLSRDLKILWRTLSTVIRRTGISQDGEATMSEFLGTRPLESQE